MATYMSKSHFSTPLIQLKERLRAAEEGKLAAILDHALGRAWEYGPEGLLVLQGLLRDPRTRTNALRYLGAVPDPAAYWTAHVSTLTVGMRLALLWVGLLQAGGERAQSCAAAVEVVAGRTLGGGLEWAAIERELFIRLLGRKEYRYRQAVRDALRLGLIERTKPRRKTRTQYAPTEYRLRDPAGWNQAGLHAFLGGK
jgi:hypothetical protein